jgi:hypothetical protein
VNATEPSPETNEPLVTVIQEEDVCGIALAGVKKVIEDKECRAKGIHAALFVLNQLDAVFPEYHDTLLNRGSIYIMARALSRVTHYKSFASELKDPQTIAAYTGTIGSCLTYLCPSIDQTISTSLPWLHQALRAKLVPSISRFIEYYDSAAPGTRMMIDQQKLAKRAIHALIPIKFWLECGSFAIYHDLRKSFRHMNILDQLPALSEVIKGPLPDVHRNPTMGNLQRTLDDCKVEWYRMEAIRQKYIKQVRVAACGGPFVRFFCSLNATPPHR